MFAEYWRVGATSPVPDLDLSPNSVGEELAEDWLPELAKELGISLADWADSMLTPYELGKRKYACLHHSLGTAERQWKGFASWLLGVAGARLAMRKMGYTWIAPLSAFYKRRSLHIATPAHPSPDCAGLNTHRRLVATKADAPESRLQPDYVACRLVNGDWEFAIVEAKGTASRLHNMTKPKDPWARQVRNAELCLDNDRLPHPRRIVIATSSNPNPMELWKRRVQVRAWNSPAGANDAKFDPIAVSVATVHVAALTRNLGLPTVTSALVTNLPQLARVSTLEERARAVLQRGLRDREDLPGDRLAYHLEMLEHRLERLQALKLLGAQSGASAYTRGRVEGDYAAELGELEAQLERAIMEAESQLPPPPAEPPSENHYALHRTALEELRRAEHPIPTSTRLSNSRTYRIHDLTRQLIEALMDPDASEPHRLERLKKVSNRQGARLGVMASG